MRYEVLAPVAGALVSSVCHPTERKRRMSKFYQQRKLVTFKIHCLISLLFAVL